MIFQTDINTEGEEGIFTVLHDLLALLELRFSLLCCSLYYLPCCTQQPALFFPVSENEEMRQNINRDDSGGLVGYLSLFRLG